ncbi:MAG: hypothetical protein K1X67_00535 [Fimbriimonadaceae bacterium]|nr:hypothetical protein [Fimbriimonadaceae bacterium]
MLQPEGTEIFWDVPEDTYSYILENYVNPSGFDLAAEGPFLDRKIAAFFVYDFYPTDNGVTWTTSIPVTGEDDTTSSTYLDKGAPVAMVSSISAHRPTSMSLDTSIPHYPAHPPGTDYCGADYWYRLKDQTGSFFPGVWVNERFPTPSQFPPNFHTNDEDLFWTTLKAGAPGKMNAADWIVNIWPSGNQTTYHIDHQYWAASKATSGSSGINVYDGLITLTPGQPGTAIQVP